MKKILHIQVIPKLSGVQKVSLEILRKLPCDYYDKHILFGDIDDCGDKQECISRFEEAGVHVMFSKHLRREICVEDIKAFKEIYGIIKKERFDIVHTNSTKPGIIGRIAATLAGTPYVVHTVHGLAFYHGLSKPKWIFYWCCEMFASFFCDRIVLVNNYYSRYFKMFRNKLTVIYNGIDFKELESNG